MNKEFRRLALQKIAENAGFPGTPTVDTQPDVVKGKLTLAEILRTAKSSGSLTSFVEKALKIEPEETGPSDFKSRFLKLKAGPEREKLVYEEIVKRKPFGNLVPITVPGPGGTKITYKVMPDYITLDGLRVPMSWQTAQKVANHFGMSLPTSKMTQQIWEAADTKIRPPPLSGGGRIGGKQYTGEQVVKSKISDSDSAIAYSQMIEDMLKDKDPKLVAGHMKTVVMTDRPDQLGLFGWSGDSDGFSPIQSGEHTGYDTSVHTEYGSGVRLIAGNVTVTLPDGKEITTTMDQVLDHPQMRQAVSKSKVQKYKV